MADLGINIVSFDDMAAILGYLCLVDLGVTIDKCQNRVQCSEIILVALPPIFFALKRGT